MHTVILLTCRGWLSFYVMRLIGIEAIGASFVNGIRNPPDFQKKILKKITKSTLVDLY